MLISSTDLPVWKQKGFILVEMVSQYFGVSFLKKIDRWKGGSFWNILFCQSQKNVENRWNF